MKRIGQIVACGLGVACVMSVPAMALTTAEVGQLKKLDPQTRLEQRCDIEAMSRLRSNTKWRPDKVLAYAYSDPVMSKYRIKADGAAFRSRGKWYHLSYDCSTANDYLTISSFTYKIGDLIPRSHWDAHYLVP